MKRNILMIFLCAVVGGITAYAVTKSIVPDTADELVAACTGQPASTKTVNLSLSDYPDFTYAAESAVNAVVYVKVTVKSTYQTPNSIFDYFFGYEGTPKEREQQGSGSGVIIREDGYIVTNNHVIEGATKIEVTLNDNTTYQATLVGTDPATDVALIKIDAEGLPTVEFGDSDNLRLGEWVLAIGSPYDLRSTITAGIVSAKGRSMPNYNGEFKIESFIQTDAAVNPGNSGGALVNKEGKLVGINTAIISQTGSYAGYSFAVPVNIVKRIVYDLMDFGSVKRALLGVTMQNIDNDKAKELKLPGANGVYIVEVVKNGTADKAGIRKGDVLVKVDSVVVTDGASVQEAVSKYHPGDEADVAVYRDGKVQTIHVVFQGVSDETGSVDETGAVAFYGAKIRQADKQTLARFSLKGGVEVVSVGQGKLSEAGVDEGFIILYVNDEAVRTPQEVLDIVKKSKRAVYVEGITPSGKASYFGFAK